MDKPDHASQYEQCKDTALFMMLYMQDACQLIHYCVLLSLSVPCLIAVPHVGWHAGW